MIELPKIYYNRVCRVQDVEAYGKACAAEAREQMREECIAAAMAEHENPNNLELIQIGALQAGRAIRKLP